MEEIVKRFDVSDCHVQIINSNYGYGVKIYDLDDNNVIDNCLYDSADDDNYFDDYISAFDFAIEKSSDIN